MHLKISFLEAAPTKTGSIKFKTVPSFHFFHAAKIFNGVCTVKKKVRFPSMYCLQNSWEFANPIPEEREKFSNKYSHLHRLEGILPLPHNEKKYPVDE